MSENSIDRRFARWLAAVAALAMLAGACGDDDAGDADIDAAAPDDSAADEDVDSSEVDADAGTDEDVTEADVTDPDPGDEPDVETDGEPDDEPEQTTTTSAAPTTTAEAETTTTLPAESGLPPEEERGENEAGVRIDLDETATLTCANAEFARDALRQSMLDDALQYTAAAADRAEPSAVVELAELVPEMRAAQTEAEIEAVIDEALVICVERGHQI